MATKGAQGVFERAWKGFSDFFTEFTAGPPRTGPWKPTYAKPKRTRAAKRALKKKPRRGTKLATIKPDPAAVKQEVKVLYQLQNSQPKREAFENEPNWNSVLPKEEEVDPGNDSDEKRAEVVEKTAEGRADAITKAKRQKVQREPLPYAGPQLSRKRKHLLFMNPGTLKIMEAVSALTSGAPLPTWAEPFANQLSVGGNKLYFEDMEMATEETKREQVKLHYYDPKEPSTIQPLTDKLREIFANVTKKDVSRILRSLETYQLNFRRRLPLKVQGRMSLKKPGVIMLDTFYPSKAIDGWRGKYTCLCCMDGWSRFSRVYVLSNKTAALIQKHIEKFLAEFASLGHMPKMILSDKGSELAGAPAAIEPYRTKPGEMVHHSVTGQPVLMVENMQSQYQRRMAVFRTASLTDDPSAIMDDISNHLNSQKRPDRGNLTPMQLLTLNAQQIKQINETYKDRAVLPEVTGLKKLEVGHAVRVLMMTRKEQVDPKMKGFRPKWSHQVFTVLKKTKLQLNPTHFRYYVGKNQSYYRHELLWVPKEIDREVVAGLVRGEGDVGGLDYDPDEESEYDPDEDD